MSILGKRKRLLAVEEKEENNALNCTLPKTCFPYVQWCGFRSKRIQTTESFDKIETKILLKCHNGEYKTESYHAIFSETWGMPLFMHISEQCKRIQKFISEREHPNVSLEMSGVWWYNANKFRSLRLANYKVVYSRHLTLSKLSAIVQEWSILIHERNLFLNNQLCQSLDRILPEMARVGHVCQILSMYDTLRDDASKLLNESLQGNPTAMAQFLFQTSITFHAFRHSLGRESSRMRECRIISNTVTPHPITNNKSVVFSPTPL